MANLAFDVNSLHFRYYKFIRWMWGCTDVPERTSLCLYCQTMFWGSILVVMFSWALAFGWVFMKIGRAVCKFQNPYLDVAVRFLDKKTEWMTVLNEGPQDFVKSPMGTGLRFCAITVTVLLGVISALIIVAGFLGVIGLCLWNIVDLGAVIVDLGAVIGAVIFYGIAWVFTQLFMGLYWIGFACDKVYSGVIWLFTNGSLWYAVLSWISYISAWLLGIGVVSIGLCLICIAIFKLPFMRRFGKYLTNKFNGFAEAQERRKARTLEALKELPPWKCNWCGYSDNPAENSHCDECRTKPEPKWLWLFIWVVPILWVVNKTGSTVLKIRNREIDVIGPLGIVWSYILAIKKGVCPIVEFVDSAQLQAGAQASAQERMEREADESSQNPSATDH